LNGLAVEPKDFDLNAWVDEIRGFPENLRSTLEADPKVGRQQLRRLPGGSSIPVTPSPGGGFTYSGMASLADSRKGSIMRAP
jgi:hypothetical protein